MRGLTEEAHLRNELYLFPSLNLKTANLGDSCDRIPLRIQYYALRLSSMHIQPCEGLIRLMILVLS